MIDIDETEKRVKLLQSKSFIRMQLDLPEVLDLIERVREAEAHRLAWAEREVLRSIERDDARGERDVALARIAELEAEAFKQRRKFENMAHFSEQHQERAERAEARIAEAAKLHRKVEVAWRDGSHVEFVCNYCSDYEDDPWPCKTAVSLGLNEGENDK